MREGDKVSVGNLSAGVIETPGHTLGHITYWFHGDKLAFAGDTLFSIGCGRVIEGTMEMMWASLLKLRDLPGDTRVYCGHEYTLSNIKFAQTVEPDNKALIARAAQAAKQIAAGQPTIPTTIDEEKAANPFLRADVAAVAAAVGLAGKSAGRSVRRDQDAEEQVLAKAGERMRPHMICKEGKRALVRACVVLVGAAFLLCAPCLAQSTDPLDRELVIGTKEAPPSP